MLKICQNIFLRKQNVRKKIRIYYLNVNFAFFCLSCGTCPQSSAGCLQALSSSISGILLQSTQNEWQDELKKTKVKWYFRVQFHFAQNYNYLTDQVFLILDEAVTLVWVKGHDVALIEGIFFHSSSNIFLNIQNWKLTLNSTQYVFVQCFFSVLSGNVGLGLGFDIHQDVE